MVRPLALAVCVLFGAITAPAASGQALDTRETYPDVTAAGRDWLRHGDPVLFAGDQYFPAGPAVHFQPDLMLPTGSFDGVPLYADTSLEPYSQVLVPIGRGLLQPYERRRDAELAGTTGSRSPSFPVSLRPDVPVQGTGWQDDSPRQEPRRTARAPIAAPPEERRPGIVSARTPQGNRGIWIRYEGRRWEAAGEAVALDAGFRKVGDYRGFPVYAREAASTREATEIYIPSRDDMLTPYKAVAE
jgi:hypothetical protein